MNTAEKHRSLVATIVASRISRGLADPGAGRGPDSCDCSRDFTQCNYHTDTMDSEVERRKRVCALVEVWGEGPKERKRGLYRLLALNTEGNEKAKSMRNLKAYQASSGTAGRKSV